MYGGRRMWLDMGAAGGSEGACRFCEEPVCKAAASVSSKATLASNHPPGRSFLPIEKKKVLHFSFDVSVCISVLAVPASFSSGY